MNFTRSTISTPFQFLFNPNFKSLIDPNPARILILPQNHPSRKPLLSHNSKFPNLNLTAKKRNFQIKASIESNNGETSNWLSWLPTGGLAADKVLRLISSATSSPICQFISSPTTFLHSVDPRIKLVWLLALVVLPARSQLVVRFGLVAYIALLSVLVLPKHVWMDQLGRVSLLCGILFILSGLGTDGAPQLVQLRTPASSLTGLPDLPTSLSGYSYLIMKLGPLQFTRKGLSVATTASCLTFIIFQSASLCLATTTPEQLAFALRWFMLPLRYIGVPVAEIVLTLMLSLRFINLVFDEVRNVAMGIVSRRINWQQLTMMETIDIFASYIRRIFKNIFSHAEQISQMKLYHYSTWFHRLLSLDRRRIIQSTEVLKDNPLVVLTEHDLMLLWAWVRN
ncbi:protein ABCI12, chloroplastic isoform X3 [Durio zibethinus]|uniref:Protein ABCI12, chloroplastic isoform X3 n=1 Tax=Durio zibethinus TaxID=66656 RepID=A0A6P5X569_DURZI|nr:protein ABCI12, chloroplastic isoform X3 [Durio zibethinus]